MTDQELIDVLCTEWRWNMARIDTAFTDGKLEVGFADCDQFAGWLVGFRDACFACGLAEAAECVHEASSLLIQRKHIALMHRFAP